MPEISKGKYVVVGGASLLGSHIGEQLLAEGAREVLLLDNLSLGAADNIAHLLDDPRCRFVRSDVMRLNELLDPLEGTEGVFMVAAFLGKPMWDNPWAGLDVNLRGWQNVLEACRVKGVRKVVFSSSVGVYGVADEAAMATEHAPFQWEDLAPEVILYSSSKIAGEGLARLYEKKYGLEFIALRYTNLYGERLHRRALQATRMVEIYDQIRAGERPVIEGDGTATQDYIYVGDVARANLLAMTSTASGHGMNIACGASVPRQRIAELVLKSCGSDLTPVGADGGAVAPAAEGSSYTIDRARSLIGWEPLVSIEEGIDRLVRWLDRAGK